MEQNLEDQTPAADAAAAAPVRRRASRRVSAAAGAAPEVAADAVATAAAEPAAAEQAPAAAPAVDDAPAKAAPKRASRARKKAEPAAETAAAAEAPASAAAAETPAETPAEAPAEAPAPKTTRATAKSKAAAAAAEAAAATEAQPAAEQEPAAPKKRATRSRKAAAAEPATDQADAPAAADAAPAEADAAAAETSAPAEATEAAPARRSRRRSTQNAETAETADAQPTAEEGKGRGRNGGKQDQPKAEQAKAEQAKTDQSKAEADKSSEKPADKQNDKQSQNDRGDNGKQESGSRSSRTRQRDRKRRGGDDLEPEIAEDDVLLPVAGILDVLDNYAFVRTSGYLPGVSDVYVALGQVKKYNLRRGDAIVGAIRQPREGDSGGRQKYNAIVKIDSVNGKPIEDAEKRPEITEMTPVFPQQRLKLDASADRALGRAIDAIAPVGLGQRGLLVLPEQFSGSEVVRELAADISANAPEAHLMVVLTDAQPEVATELSRTISGEVVAATFDRLPEDQTTITELGIDRARRLVELGHDVVVLVDSLNRLARGYAQSQQPAARPAIGAVDEHAVFQVKRLLAAARNVENGGSLTVLATVRAENGNEADTILLRELKGVVNSVIEFDQASSIEAPKLNAQSSRTQNLSAMLDAKELAAVTATRQKQLATKSSAK